MLSEKTICFLGAGNIAEALIKGLIESSVLPASRIIASDRLGERLLHLAETYKIEVYNKKYDAVRNADIILLAVKPGDVDGLLADIAPDIGPGKLIVSVAAGVTTARILEALKQGGLAQFTPVVRAMPNTPAIVGEGAVAICASLGTGRDEVRSARALFEAVGMVVEVEDEALMDAVTGLSGSGPAYVFLFMEALSEGGEKMGLTAAQARLLALQTVLGSAKLAMESGKSLKELREMVSSPGGTTIEGLKKLDEGGFKAVVRDAVRAAALKARELAG